MQTRTNREVVLIVVFLVVGSSTLFYFLGRTHDPNQEPQLADLSGEPSALPTFLEEDAERTRTVIVGKPSPLDRGHLALDASPQDVFASARFPVEDLLLTALRDERKDIQQQRRVRETMLSDLRAKHRELRKLVSALEDFRDSETALSPDSECVTALTPRLCEFTRIPPDEIKKLFEPDYRTRIALLVQEFGHCEQGYKVLITLAEARYELAKSTEALSSQELLAFEQAKKRYEQEDRESETTIALWQSSKTVSKAALAVLMDEDRLLSRGVGFTSDGTLTCAPRIRSGSMVSEHIYPEPLDLADSMAPKEEEGKYPKANCERFLAKLEQAAKEEGISLEGIKLPPGVVHKPTIADSLVKPKRNIR